MKEFKKGEKVDYIGKGFIGYNKDNSEMEIIKKNDYGELRDSYRVKYGSTYLEVYHTEIERPIKAIYKTDLEQLQNENAELLEALKLAKKIIHRQMGKGLVLSTKDYNKMFDPIKQIEL